VDVLFSEHSVFCVIVGNVDVVYAPFFIFHFIWNTCHTHRKIEFAFFFSDVGFDADERNLTFFKEQNSPC